MNDLQKYAQAFHLEIFTDPEQLADNTGVDVEELPSGVTAAACYNDGHWYNVAAFIQDGQLKRFGYEALDEDPTIIISTTLSELMTLGDPEQIP